MSDATSLHTIATDLLAAVVASLGTDAPSAQFVTIGEPAYDGCDLVSVHIVQLGVTSGMWAGMTAGERYASTNTVVMQITLLRCVKVVAGGARISVPTAAQMTADAEQLDTDVWKVWNGIRTRHREGALWNGPDCHDVFFGPAVPIAPQGGGAGWTIDAMTTIPGYTNG